MGDRTSILGGHRGREPTGQSRPTSDRSTRQPRPDRPRSDRRSQPSRIDARRRDRSGDGVGNRAQTALDFVVAMALFLGVVGFVFLFVPDMLSPFTGDEEVPQVADRVADRLVTTHLGSAEGPAILNATCTRAFFNETTDCPEFDGTVTLEEQFGVNQFYDLNVTLQDDTDGDGQLEVLCAGTSIGPCSGSGARLAVGDRLPADRGSVATARRVVRVEGTNAVLVVRVW